MFVVVGRDLRQGQALTCTHLRFHLLSIIDMNFHRRAGLQRHELADRISSEYASNKAWESVLTIAATSSPMGMYMYSLLLILAQNAMLFTHHQGSTACR